MRTVSSTTSTASTAVAAAPAAHNAPARIPAPRRYRWSRADTVSTTVVAVLALITRFVGLTGPQVQGTPVFDEKHYVPQAFDMVRDREGFFIGGIESNPGYGLVVHPPLAKQIMAIGEAMFGYTPMGWRLMVALFGVGTILLIMALARRLSHSWQVATFAGIIAVFDGVLLVTSKFGMLDIFLVAFVVAAAWMLACDFEQMRFRLHDAYASGNLGTSLYGPKLGFRWWRFGAGVCLGLALSVKWSGLYYIVFFGLMSVFGDLALRRRYGVKRYVRGTLLRDTIPALGSLAVIPIALYIYSWRAWFGGETSVYRHAGQNGTITPDGTLYGLPDAWSGWLYYHQSVLKFHETLTSSSGHSHPWDSKPWSWLVAARPILYYSSTGINCGSGKCQAMLFLFGTPAIWWLTVPVLLWALWCLIIHKDRRFLVPVVAFATGFLPWVAAYDRQMYFFYAAPLVPFTIVALALTLGQIVGHGKPVAWKFIRTIAGYEIPRGTFAAVVYLSLVIAMFAYFSPILYGYAIPTWWYNQIMWLPSWK